MINKQENVQLVWKDTFWRMESVQNVQTESQIVIHAQMIQNVRYVQKVSSWSQTQNVQHVEQKPIARHVTETRINVKNVTPNFIQTESTVIHVHLLEVQTVIKRTEMLTHV